MNLRPLQDWILIERSDASDVTAGGIHIPDSAREKPAEGIVIAIGPGKYKPEKGKEKSKEKIFVPTSVVPGQCVVYTKYMATEVELDGTILTLVREEDILCTIEGIEKPLVRSVARNVLVPTAPASGVTKPAQKSRASAAAPKGKKVTSTSSKKKIKKKKSVKTKKSVSKSTSASKKKSKRQVSPKVVKKKAVKKKTTGKSVARKKSLKTVKKKTKTKKAKKKR